MRHWDDIHERLHGHRFERGDLKYVILDHLKDHPSYGYEIIRELGDRFHGFYTPSAGVVYPTLQWLEDLGYVTGEVRDGRKVYTVTDEGRGFLKDEKASVDDVKGRMRDWSGPFERREVREEFGLLRRELQGFAKQMRGDLRWADAEKLRRLREVIHRAIEEAEEILHAPASKPGDERTGPPASGGSAGDEAA